ncbi:MAG: hypothetical protein WKG00_09020 [Polyangiaceae bacterium]
MRVHRGLMVLCVALAMSAPAWLVAPGAAWAQEADATYKQHMENGVKLYQERNWSGAISEFQAAYSAKPKASPLLNIALCQKAQFQYPKAIATLESALARHGDSLDAADNAAAREAVAELRSLLGTVRLTVVPADASLRIDGEPLPAGSGRTPIALGPGDHVISASAPGHAPAEQRINVSSGDKDKPVELRLIPNQGRLTVTARLTDSPIAIDQQRVGEGHWSGLLDPGPHSVQIFVPGSSTDGVGRQVMVRAGGADQVKEGDAAMVPLTEGLPPGYFVTGGETETPMADLRGVYALAHGGILLLLGADVGTTLGVRLGWRPRTPFALEALLQADRITNVNEPDANLTMFRIGPNVRFMTPGRSTRYVFAIGGGISIDHVDSLDASSSATGVDGYMNVEHGLETDVGDLVLGGVAYNTLFWLGGPTDGHVDDSTVAFGLALRLGYKTWRDRPKP